MSRQNAKNKRFPYLEFDLIEIYNDHIYIIQTYRDGSTRVFVLLKSRSLIYTQKHKSARASELWAQSYINNRRKAA